MTSPSRVTAYVFLSSLNISLEKREGGRENERERERDPKSEL